MKVVKMQTNVLYTEWFLLCTTEIIPTRLETLLELTLRTSTANVDPFKDDLRYVLYYTSTQQRKLLPWGTYSQRAPALRLVHIQRLRKRWLAILLNYGLQSHFRNCNDLRYRNVNNPKEMLTTHISDIAIAIALAIAVCELAHSACAIANK